MKTLLKHPLIVLALGLASCGKPSSGPPPAAPMAAGPLEVGVITVKTSPVTLTQDLPGRISAFRVAEVRARVSGIVLKRLFKEGSDVKEGQVLYEIDPAQYEASLESAQGTLARAEASLNSAMLKLNRMQSLIDSRAISKQDFDEASGSKRVNEAEVLLGKAAVKTARINLDYTKVTAPITGRIGLSQVTEGAYVRTDQATLLTTVQQIDRVYVDVNQPSSDLLRLKQALTSGKLKADAAGQARVKLVYENGEIYPEEGSLEVSDVTVNTLTNSVTVRAVFPNPRNELLPGMFVRARLEEGTTPDAILVPQLAVTRNSKGEPTAMVVGAESKVELRVLETPRAVGNQWMVTSGLKAGDQLIINNLQKIRPGAPVKVAAPDSAAPAQTSSAAK
ncbi:efflux RND transporter periplasmic adaptor subunit [Prosthecobacter vanneervenii]|uniref:Membrane fusion protein (Multidrug efflux system) n=1 Tax=Prosthecobacter vanneervenii TaxID=48466 RepID=A0A7W7Y6Q3_9BACT|nr:efflux RND transporter periplasmic adaptor subunit [Prosthecobacter vanneervenii]MBB5030614.1 membrane fusion protein (multidrug efflux system) [Prosthecobacter vanneervenii]